MRKFLSFFFLFLSAPSFAAIEHVQSIIQRPDGNYDVTCIDGNTELKTKADIQEDKVCTVFKTVTGIWNLVEGGIENGVPMCDLTVSLVRTHDAFFRMSALFNPPCSAEKGETQECNSRGCSVQIAQKFYSFDFPSRDRLNVTRLADGFKAGYSGDAGTGGTGGPIMARARSTPMNGVDNVLQVTNDDGQSWNPVCDDNFTIKEAEVACREMGFSTVKELKTDLFVADALDFGLDDIICAGTEGSLFDCAHAAWKTHNCGASEHVQLTCQ